MPTQCSADQFEFEGFAGRRVVATFDGGVITSDAGALLLREADLRIGLIDRVAACFIDRRQRDALVHELPTLIGQRIVGIACGYEDINDHDQLQMDLGAAPDPAGTVPARTSATLRVQVVDVASFWPSGRGAVVLTVGAFRGSGG